MLISSYGKAVVDNPPSKYRRISLQAYYVQGHYFDLTRPDLATPMAGGDFSVIPKIVAVCFPTFSLFWLSLTRFPAAMVLIINLVPFPRGRLFISPSQKP